MTDDRKTLLDYTEHLFYMSQIESALVGYISGFAVGSLIILIILGWIAIQASSEIDRPEQINSLIEAVSEDYLDPEQEIFIVAFGIGFIMGLGGAAEVIDG